MRPSLGWRPCILRGVACGTLAFTVSSPVRGWRKGHLPSVPKLRNPRRLHLQGLMGQFCDIFKRRMGWALPNPTSPGPLEDVCNHPLSFLAPKRKCPQISRGTEALGAVWAAQPGEEFSNFPPGSNEGAKQKLSCDPQKPPIAPMQRPPYQQQLPTLDRNRLGQEEQKTVLSLSVTRDLLIGSRSY